jgi:superoxide dismutase, Cu-Zn family
MRKLWVAAALIFTACASGEGNLGTLVGRVNFVDANGQPAGDALLYAIQEGTRVVANLPNLPAGAHGFHFHAVGTCQPPAFESAGSHFNPTGRKHGLQNPNGPHLGDLPNVSTTRASLVAPGVQLTGANGLLDADGAALVVHANPDDLHTDPSGNSGARIRCGVIQQASQ